MYFAVVELRQKITIYLLESLAACQDSSTNLIMYFTVNLAFTNYINQFNLKEELEAPIFTNKTPSEVTLPIFS